MLADMRAVHTIILDTVFAMQLCKRDSPYLKHIACWWLQLQVQHLVLQEGSMGLPLVLLQGDRRGMHQVHAHTCHALKQNLPSGTCSCVLPHSAALHPHRTCRMSIIIK